jgi:hypothetical protein
MDALLLTPDGEDGGAVAGDANTSTATSEFMLDYRTVSDQAVLAAAVVGVLMPSAVSAIS